MKVLFRQIYVYHFRVFNLNIEKYINNQSLESLTALTQNDILL